MEEATKCIGTPDKNRWSLVYSAVDNSINQPLQAGIYRWDVYRNGQGSSSVIIFDKTTETRILPHDHDTASIQAYINNEWGHPNWTLYASNEINTTPNISLADIEHIESGKGSVFRLD
ncbi:MAG: hypothetical protein LBL52_00550 [Rickettsiales bacterium]|nr:hypothetical protein [Rickettsiales bacterium]